VLNRSSRQYKGNIYMNGIGQGQSLSPIHPPALAKEGREKAILQHPHRLRSQLQISHQPRQPGCGKPCGDLGTTMAQ